jgi:hypothetical protein
VGTVCVEVAVGTDPRLPAALASLERQSRRPDRVLLAASPMTPEALLDAARASAPSLPVLALRFPGGVVDARAGATAVITEEFTLFLDSDELAPPEWLGALVAPLEAGVADYTGGPTRAVRPPQHPVERYYDLLEASIYEQLAPANPVYLPLQNSAWRTADLRRLGFDPRIPYAEDHDLESRAVAEGLRGRFVPEAWVYHDKSDERSYLRWARKRYRYLLAMAMSLLKNQRLEGRLRERRAPVRHPLRYLEAMLKPPALLHAWVRWHRFSRAPRPGDPGRAATAPRRPK